MQCNERLVHSNKRISIVFLFILAIFLLSRVAYLDNDLPYKILHSYAAFDEFYYTIPGFNLFHYGEVNPNIISNVIEDKSVPTNIAQNIATYLNLRIFGNNFYGLRMGSVVCSLFIVILFYLILKRIIAANKNEMPNLLLAPQNILWILPLIYLSTDFSLLNAGRVAEPTIYRIMALVVVLYIGSFIETSNLKSWHSFLLGFLTFANVSFVYIYNAYVFAAFGVALFFWANKNGVKNALKHIAFFILGAIFCLLIYQFYIDIAYNSSILEVYKNLVPFQSRMGAGTAGVDSYLINITLVWMTNIFSFNLILFFIFLISIPIFIDRLKKYRSNFDILLISLIGFLILQSIIINDYALRKLLVMLPLVLIISLQSYMHASAYFKELTFEKLRFIKIYWALIWIINILVFFFYTNSDLSGDSKLVSDYFMVLNLMVFVFGSIILSLKYLYAISIRKIVLIGLLISFLIPNIFLDLKYVFLNRTTYYRDTMISMSNKIDGKMVVGGLAYSFRLYNTSVPLLNFYVTRYSSSPESADRYHQYFDQLFIDGAGSYSIGIVEDLPEEGVVNATYMEQHHLQLDELYNLKDLLDINIGLFSSKSNGI